MDIQHIASFFPIFKRASGKSPFIYLDSAATSQKPQQVINALNSFYSESNANVHRGVYSLSEQATFMYEQARMRVAQFINAQPNEIIFTSGTTESINMVASSWALHTLGVGDEILVSELEHHSNLLPWQWVAQKTGARLVFIPVDEQGNLDFESFSQLLSPKTKLVSLSHVSQALGNTNDIAFVIERAHYVGAKVLIDAAQSAPHQRLDMNRLNPDFLAFSGHKMLGPFGIGVLYCASHMHDALQPYQRGGGMVYEANFHSACWLAVPHRMEAGTPAIADAIGLAAALDFLDQYVDFDSLKKHEAHLCSYFIDELEQMPRIKILGNKEQLKQQGHLVSFTVDGVHPHDVAAYLDQFGICVRAGHHCAQPLAKKLGIDASVRVSFYCYTSVQDVEQCIIALRKLLK